MGEFKVASLVIALAAQVLPADAALSRYSYAGNQLTTAAGIGYDATFRTIGSAPAGLGAVTFSMIGYLGPNRPFDQYTPMSWQISDGVHTFSSAAPPPHLNFYAKFATDSTGAIVDWYVQLVTYDDFPSPDPYNAWDDILIRTSTDTASLPVPYDESRVFSAVLGDFARTNDYRALAYDLPGAWSVSDVTSNGLVAEPLGLSLLGIGLAGLAAARRVHRSQAHLHQ